MVHESRLRIATELAGALSIVLSLVFVGLELRHSNNVAEADAVMQINAMYLEASLAAGHDADLIKLLATENQMEALAVRRGFRNISMLNITEAAWKSADRGIMDDEHLAAYMTDACDDLFPEGFSDLVLTPFGQTPWDKYKLILHPRFVDAYERFCKDL